jgi:hypothetical protein
MRAQIGKVQREILECLNTKYPMPVNLVIEDVIESSDKLVTKANLLRTMRALVTLQYMAETADGLLLTPTGRDYLKIDQIRRQQRKEAIQV